MKHLFYFLFAIGLLSCEQTIQQEEPVTIDSSEVISEETTIEEPEPIVQIDFPSELSQINWEELSLPFELKEEELFKIEPDESSALSQTEFHFLDSLFEMSMEDEDWFLRITKQIYQLKSEGKYGEYVDGLDLAQTKDAVAYPYGKNHLDTAILLFWYVDYSSYEACPYYSGKQFFVTNINPTRSFSWLISEEDSGGDPPASGTTFCHLTIDEKLQSITRRTNREYDDEVLVETKTEVDSAFLIP